jgi:hypothetical protein
MPDLRRFELLTTLKMGTGVESIFNESDTQSVRELKQACLNELEVTKASQIKGVGKRPVPHNHTLLL